MKQIALITALSALSLSSHAVSPKGQTNTDKRSQRSEARMIEMAQKEIAYQLIDPSSASFRNVRVSPNQVAVCGEINAKNSYGGYVGYRPFIFTREKKGIYGDGTYFVEARWKERCVDGTLVDDDSPNARPLP